MIGKMNILANTDVRMYTWQIYHLEVLSVVVVHWNDLNVEIESGIYVDTGVWG